MTLETPIYQDCAPAKLNLYLHITGRRTDGYHEMESVFVFTQHGDMLSLEASDVTGFTIKGPFAKALDGADQDNLAWRAFTESKAYFGLTGHWHITLEKNLPVAAGIGGGSADAAAAIRLVAQAAGARYIDHKPDLEGLALTLGADVPACLWGGAKFVTGIGDHLKALPAKRHWPVLLVNLGMPVSTPLVFQHVRTQTPPFAEVWGDAVTDMAEIAGYTHNSLTQAAIGLVPGLAGLLDHLNETQGVLLARLSGSGGTCFSVYADTASRDAAHEQIKARWPDAWSKADSFLL